MSTRTKNLIIDLKDEIRVRTVILKEIREITKCPKGTDIIEHIKKREHIIQSVKQLGKIVK